MKGGVEIVLPNGTRVSTFVDKSQVSHSDPLDGYNGVDGRLKVRVVEYTPDGVYIDIPGEDSIEGSRFQVPLGFLEKSDPDNTQA